jgi:hypothetical protein
VGEFEWSADSTRIAYETRPTPDADDGRKADILEVALETGAIRNIAATSATEAQPHYSPDGHYLVYVRGNLTGNRINGNRMVLLTLPNLSARELPTTPAESPVINSWAVDSKKVDISEGLYTRSALHAMPVDGPASVAFQTSRGVFANNVVLNRTGTYAGLAMQAPDEPIEAYVILVSSMKPVRVSAANVALPKQPLGETRVIRWEISCPASIS